MIDVFPYPLSLFVFFYQSARPPPSSTLFPYTTLFRSGSPEPAELSCLRDCSSSCRSWAEATNNTDRKSTRLNSSHVEISYAVFCLKKKNIQHAHRLVYDKSGLHNALTMMLHQH